VGDIGLIKAYRADMHGNVQFNKSAMNFNMEMGKAGKRTIVEAE
jgi:acyl CoA:acetate/3-ketoacid CoA transferase alpha subunit